MRQILFMIVLSWCWVNTVNAMQTIDHDSLGEVKVPLSLYTDLIHKSERIVRSPPVGYAIGKSTTRIEVAEADGRAKATVTVNMPVQIYENKWTSVPVMDSFVALSSATMNGQEMSLNMNDRELSWNTNKAGKYKLELIYALDASRSSQGYVLAVPLPNAPATTLTAVLPGVDIDATVVPAVAFKSVTSGKKTHISANIPGVNAFQLAWHQPDMKGYVMSRARYQGELKDKAILWTATFQVEHFSEGQLKLSLLPASVTLSNVLIDGNDATVMVEDQQFVTLLKGIGMHKVSVDFQVPVKKSSGPPSATLSILKVPVSHFELTLPGKKEVMVSPAANVTNTLKENETQSSVYLPMTNQVQFSWTEAVPEEIKDEIRANATIYHTIHAEEGVLHIKAQVHYEITRGETNTLELIVPDDIQINRITAEQGGVSDWRVTQAQGQTGKQVSVFLDRKVKGKFAFNVNYERLIGDQDKSAEPITVPFIRAYQVHRQRGMAALLSAQELTLTPIKLERVTKVGENQLPAFVRNAIAMKVAHTYKYIDANPILAVKALAPERKQGKFDAQVDTLISIGDVTMKGAASIELNVKTGSIMELQLALPKDVNVLSLTGPSIRNHEIKIDQNQNLITVAFTQEMDGQFRLELNYERIMSEGGEAQTQVPTVSIIGAQVEHGRIAVEALTAVEVQPAVTEQISNLDINVLPQQLILKTTNPILLAYRYVKTGMPYRLTLKITRHKALDVQVATIEKAHYKTLFTRDGLAVTTVKFTIRNSRKQFLKLQLPELSDVWSVFVDGKVEKPASASGGSHKAGGILIRMINSTHGFPVELVYATKFEPVESMGELQGQLPLPDMIVTHSRWDIYLPDGPSYQEPESNMDILITGRWEDKAKIKRNVGEITRGRSAASTALQIQVPAQGIHYAFEKLYANQSKDPAGFSIAYVSGETQQLGYWLGVIGFLLMIIAIVLFILDLTQIPKPIILVGFIIGLFLLMYSMLNLGVHFNFMVLLGAVVAAVIAGVFLKQRLN